MLILDKEGCVIGFNFEKDSKPALFPIKGAKWNGEKWEYPELELKEKEVPTLVKEIPMSSFDFHCLIQGAIHPVSGSYKKEKSKDITVLIPSYKKARWVGEAVESALNQSLPPFKVLVLAMTDEDFDAASNAADSKVEVARHERLNASAARNLLVEMCPTEYFVFLDADDTLAPNFIETVYESEASVVGCPTKKDYDIGMYLMSERFFATRLNLNALFCKEAWNDVGGLREDLAEGGEDCYFWNELFIQGKWLVDFNNKSYYVYRMEDENSLFANKERYAKSLEREFWLHRDWYVKCLEESYEKSSKCVLKAFDDFLESYDESAEPYSFIMKDFGVLMAEETVLNEKWNDCYSLIKESRTRDTDCVCEDLSVPQLYGRKFDIFVFAKPSFNWKNDEDLESAKGRDFYVNNPSVNLSLTCKELMERYCVVFSDDYISTSELFLEKEDKEKVEALQTELKKEMEKEFGDGVVHQYTFTFFTQCDKRCPYCSQTNFEDGIGEEELYENFLAAVEKVESLHGRSWRPQLAGGELTLCSDEFIRKIMDRLEGYDVKIMTNGNKYLESPFYDYPNLSALVHITKPPFDDSFLRPYDASCIVAVKPYFSELLSAIKEGKISAKCRILYYKGNDERFVLSEEENRQLNEALKECGILRPEFRPGNVKECIERANNYRIINLWDMTITPCCGIGEPSMPLKEWNLQDPSGKVCADCPEMIY